jgi:hypothetical protein
LPQRAVVSKQAKKRIGDHGTLFFISVLLHSLLILLPWQEKSRPLALSSIPTSPIPIVDASRLSTLPVSEPQPLPAVPAKTPAPTTPLSPILPPPAAVSVNPPAALAPDEPILDRSIAEANDSQAAEPTSEVADSASPTTPSTDDSNSDSVTPNVAPTDEAKIVADWENLVSHFQEQDDGFKGFTLLDIFENFGEPEQVNQFFDENNQPKLNVLSYYLFPKQTPEQVLQSVVMPELGSNTGFNLQRQEDFTAGWAYQLSQGEMLRYLIIVQLNEGSGSVLLLSSSLLGNLTTE